MRSGKLRLVGIALAAAAFGATGCDGAPGGGDQARTETGTRPSPGGAAPAPDVGVSGGTAAGADTPASAETTAPPPVNARPDTTPATPKVDTSPARPRPPAQAARRDTATPAPEAVHGDPQRGPPPEPVPPPRRPRRVQSGTGDARQDGHARSSTPGGSSTR